MKVRDILKTKGPEVFTIGEDKPLRDVLAILVKNNIGVLMVLNSNARIVGVISERDILRKTYEDPDHCLDLTVKDVMTKEVIIAEPDDDISYVESIITENRVRHIPIVQKKVLVGIISIGDVVKNMLSAARHENKYLRDYIEGSI